MENLLAEILVDYSCTAQKLTEESKAILRDKISVLESFLLELPQVETPISHHFSKKVYAREMRLSKGTLITGAIHKFENMNIISQGEVSFFSIDGAVRVKAPHTFVSSPGVKRVIYAHEDTVWTTIHGTEETDVDKIRDEVIATDYTTFLENNNKGILWHG